MSFVSTCLNPLECQACGENAIVHVDGNLSGVVSHDRAPLFEEVIVRGRTMGRHGRCVDEEVDGHDDVMRQTRRMHVRPDEAYAFLSRGLTECDDDVSKINERSRSVPHALRRPISTTPA